MITGMAGGSLDQGMNGKACKGVRGCFTNPYKAGSLEAFPQNGFDF